MLLAPMVHGPAFDRLQRIVPLPSRRVERQALKRLSPEPDNLLVERRWRMVLFAQLATVRTYYEWDVTVRHIVELQKIDEVGLWRG